MTLVIEITAADGAVKEMPVGTDAPIVTAVAGHAYRVIADAPSELANAQIRRVGEDLIISDLPEGLTLTLESFFASVGEQTSPVLHLDSLGGAADETLTQSSEPIAALTTGGFLLWAGPGANAREPVAPESEFNWRPVAAIGAGVVVAAGAGGGSGGGDDASIVGSDQTPDTPTINTDQVTSTTPVISGTGTPGSTITMLIDLGGSGSTVTYQTVVQANGQWSVDTATATPFSGSMPAGGLPLDAPSPVRAVANSSGGNSGLAAGSLEVDQTPPSVTATLDQIESDAAAPVGDTDLSIKPGRLEAGDSTNDTSPTLTGTISAPLAPNDVVVVVRNGEQVGEATVTGLNWRFTDSDVPAGTHNYAVQVSDPAGNTTAPSAAISINVDGTAPQTPSLDPVATDDIVTLAEAEAGVLISGNAEANSTVTVQWGAASQTTIAGNNGVFSTTFEASALPGDGRTPVSVISTDSFGNVSESVARPVNIAAGLPAAPIIDTDSALLAGDITAINAREAAGGFNITGSAEPGTPISVVFRPVNDGQTVEANSVVTNTGEFSVRFANGSVPDGEYEVSASVSDFAGQNVQGPVVNVLVDTVAPESSAIVTGAIDDQPNVTGAMPSGAITNDATPTITGSVSGNLAPNESVLILRDGQPVGNAELNGRQWQFEESALPEGQYLWSAVVVDNAGNTGPASSTSFTLTLDLTAPAPPAINALTGDDVITGTDASGGVQVTGSGPANGQVQLDWAGQLQTVDINAAGQWSATFANPPADGRTQITASVVDAAGNRAEAFRTVTVDTQPPPTPGISTVANNDVVNAAEAAQGVSVAGTGEAGTRVDVQWGALSESVTVSSAGFWTVNFANVPPDGSTTITANAVDVGGNRSANATRGVIIDTTAPPAPDIEVIAGDDVISANEAANGVQIRGRAQAGSDVTVRWDGANETTQANSAGVWQVTFNPVPGNGVSTVSATATDSAGNESAAGTRDVTVNTVAVPAPPTILPVASDNAINAAEAEQGPRFSGSSEPGARVTVNWEGATQTAIAGNAGAWSVTFSPADIPSDGSTSISVVAENAGGQSAPTTHAFLLDTTAPPTPGIDPVTGNDVINPSESAGPITISGSAQTDTVVRVNWGDATTTANTAPDGRWSAVFNSVPVSAGASVIEVIASDFVGNRSETAVRDVRVITVQPAQTPTIAPIGTDGVVNAAEAADGVTLSGLATPGVQINITWGSYAATTVASANGNWTNTVPASAIPPDGNSVVSVTATNAGGTSEPATANVTIDTTPPAQPVVTAIAGDDLISLAEQAEPIIVTGTAAANAAITVSWGVSTQAVNANAGGAWQASFNGLPPGGENELTVRATDAAGNNSALTTHEFTIEQPAVAPNPPTIQVISGDDVVNAADANGSIAIGGASDPGTQIDVNWGGASESTVTNNAGFWSVQFDSADIPADGVTTVTVVASADGQSSNPATRSVTVDTEAPAQLVTITDLIDNEGATTLSIGDGGTTTDLTPEIVLDLSSALAPTDTLVLTMDGDTLLTLNANDDFSFELGPLAEGTHTFTAQVIDAAQNAGVASDPFTVIFEQAQGLNGTV